MADGAIKGGNFSHYNTTAEPADRVMPLFSLKGRTAIVSGAGAGIGLAVAQGLAEAGANVAIWYNSNKKALDRAKEIAETYKVKCTLLRDQTVPSDRVGTAIPITCRVHANFAPLE
jgi:sorbose reductase